MNKTVKKWMYAGGLIVSAAMLATGCGGGKGESSPSPAASQPAAGGDSAAHAITVTAKNFEFDQKEIKVKQGETVSITLKNDQGNHGFKLEGYDKEVKNGQTVTFTADKAGEFNFECSIMCGKGHADMTGKFIVE